MPKPTRDEQTEAVIKKLSLWLQWEQTGFYENSPESAAALGTSEFEHVSRWRTRDSVRMREREHYLVIRKALVTLLWLLKPAEKKRRKRPEKDAWALIMGKDSF